MTYQTCDAEARMTEGQDEETSGGSGLTGFLRRHNELILYIAAGVAYITLGVFVKQALALWIEGAAFLLLAVWLLPALIQRLRRLL